MRDADPADALAALPPLREVIAARGLTARKGLGQHFLLDLNLTAKIARAAGELRDAAVIEVGPGPGGLTRALLAAGAAQVLAIERDERCLAALAPLIAVAGGRLTIVPADALHTDGAALLRAGGWRGPIKIVANLPYNVGTALILQWLEAPETYAAIVVLVQKEVAERLAAAPGGKAYGRLSVLAQWLCEVHLAFDIGPRAFTPPPQVTSTVVVLTPRAGPLAPADRAALETVTRAAFGQRRKMLRASLKALGLDPLPLLDVAGVAPTARAEELSVEDFCRLANAYAATKI